MGFPIVNGLRGLELGDPGPSRAFLNDCVLNGNKRATAGFLSEYVEENEPWEHVGERLVLVDDDLKSLALLEVTRVEPTTFAEVTWEFAEAEGEGFTDLDDWRQRHVDFWARSGQHVADETPLMCLYFKLISRNDA
ncbi:MAG TPA: ASCH domain-containing protein [Homoserinimonas sp.]|nr:ASCH domain-containing protein [Homoserinimonas sp.]